MKISERYRGILSLILVAISCSMMTGLNAHHSATIDHIPSDRGYIGQEERQSVISYHNNSLDQLWYGTDRWGVKFDLRSITAIDSFTVQTVSIYFPQAEGSYNLLIYQDSLQPLDSLVVSYSDIALENQGWNNINLPLADHITGNTFWVVVEYETNPQSRYMGASATDGAHSYYWVPPFDQVSGYFANMADTNISSELLFSISGTLHFEGQDLELISFDFLGNFSPGGLIYPEVTVRNNSSAVIDELIGISVRLTNPSPVPSESIWNVTIPLQLYLEAGADTTAVFNQPQSSYRMLGVASQYQLRAELQYDLDLYPANDLITFSFNNFQRDRDKFLVENFLRIDHQPSMDILNIQQDLMADSLYFLNYFPNPNDTPFYTPTAAQQRDYYNLSGYPFTIVEGLNRIVGYTGEYETQLGNLLAAAGESRTFLRLLTTSVQKTLDPEENLMQLRFDMKNDSTRIFSENLSNLRMFFALTEKNHPEMPGSHLLYLHRYQSTGSLNLGYENMHNFEWDYNLQTIQTIYWELNRDNLAHFDLSFWLQDNQRKNIYFFETWGLDEFDLVVSAEDDHFADLVNPTFSTYPNPVRKNEPLKFSFSNSRSVTEVKIRIYNIKGQLLKELQYSASDSGKELLWDGTQENGRRIGSGIYLLKAEFVDTSGHNHTVTRKIVSIN